jgi:PPOX class F420-dependent enzyme/OxyR family protein
MAFTEQEIAYVQSQGLGRLATVGADGQPDVVPVAVEFDGTFLWVGGSPEVTGTRKFRNVAAGNSRVSLVIDDMQCLDPFIARASGSTAMPSNSSSVWEWSARHLHAHHPGRLVELEPRRRTGRRDLVSDAAHRPLAIMESRICATLGSSRPAARRICSG